MNRRDFIWTLPGLGASIWLTGCATDPVTGKKTMVMMGKEQEIALDKQHSPHQFSEDYGVSQDAALNQYVAGVGNRMSGRSHRPDMPYRFQAVNANYVNAYAFPGGTIAATRGILLEVESEDELAALMGHEIGHVNARHFAERQAQGTLLEIVAATATVAAASKKPQYGELAQLIGSVGGGALLAHYSRENEREADALGLEYMNKAGYNPEGMVDLMDMLNSQSKSKPNALELMFATHPMSSERLANTKQVLQTAYRDSTGKPRQKERYMDHTARVRALRPAIAEQQKGEAMLNQKKLEAAEGHFRQALTLAPDDYPGLVLMAKTQMAMKKPQEAQPYLARAKAIYPTEAQASQLTGVSYLQLRQPDKALSAFQEYDRLLPGNPNTTFLKGFSLEQMQNRRGAADEYYRYLQMTRQGNQAKHAHSRLQAWGMVK
ncbi:MAG: peptidase M48 Ste24p [bacterium]|nr:MAG: peptidase M48 Ste24p [bacterium]KAF0150395.1 MAG: peptidase M48 Ste24p [bacterium]KAF0168952.1 MAG: peptidase M48 Ste24p [bacterium]TXT32866.1 MAG: peptidase M48 Ste24p [Rhodocyclaceae bacterium]